MLAVSEEAREYAKKNGWAMLQLKLKRSHRWGKDKDSSTDFELSCALPPRCEKELLKLVTKWAQRKEW